MGESLSDPGDYYHANQALLIGITASIDRIADHSRDAFLQQDAHGEMIIERGSKAPDDLLAEGIVTMEDALALGLVKLAAEYDDKLTRIAKMERYMLEQRLAMEYANEATVSDDQLIEQIKPMMRTWRLTEHRLQAGGSITLSRSCFYESDSYVQAFMYRTIVKDSGPVATDTCITIVDSYAVHASAKRTNDIYATLFRSAPAPDAGQLLELQTYLTSLEWYLAEG